MKISRIAAFGLLAFAAFSLSSCEKHDDDMSRTALIIGNWNLTSVAVDINQNGMREDNETLPLPDSGISAKLRFLVDHTGMAFGNLGPFNGSEDFRWGFTNSAENTLVISALGQSVSLTVTRFQGRNMTLLFGQPGLPAIWEDFQKQ